MLCCCAQFYFRDMSHCFLLIADNDSAYPGRDLSSVVLVLSRCFLGASRAQREQPKVEEWQREQGNYMWLVTQL